MEDMNQQQDNKKKWARLSFGVSISMMIVGLLFIVIGKTGTDIEEPDYVVYDGIDTTLAEREHTIGRADRSIEDLDIEIPEMVPNGDFVAWFVSQYDNPIEFTEYALSYADTYIARGETHWIINKVANTSTSVYDTGDILYVTVYEYIEDEEMDVETLGTGTPLFDYQIYKDNGDIVDVHDALYGDTDVEAEDVE